MAFGNGMTVSLLQIARAYTVFPNRGLWIPHQDGWSSMAGVKIRGWWWILPIRLMTWLRYYVRCALGWNPTGNSGSFLVVGDNGMGASVP